MRKLLPRNIVDVLLVILTATGLALNAAQGIEMSVSITDYRFVGLCTGALLLTYLLTRSAGGTVALFLIGCASFAVIAFAKYGTTIITLLMFLLGCGVQYLVCAIGVTKKVRRSHMIYAISGGAALVLIAAVIFAAVIRPMSPRTVDKEWVANVITLQTLDKLGVIDLDDPPEKPPTPTPPPTPPPPELPTPPPPQEELGNSSTNLENAEAIRYTHRSPLPWLIPLVIALAIVVTILVKRYLNCRWLKRTLTLEPREQIIEFYAQFLRFWALLGYRKPLPDTYCEFATATSPAIATLVGGDTDITALTDVFVRAAYGGECGDDDCGLCAKYWNRVSGKGAVIAMWRSVTRFCKQK
jgi:hypothetical protein